ncbi:MAG: hypothetical protein M1834_000866 [Cirrosporium novae-zelandiae]|nr:MAG: hypothetical protein M1834_000866 [Cirrosporium novae-zelandiae]
MLLAQSYQRHQRQHYQPYQPYLLPSDLLNNSLPQHLPNSYLNTTSSSSSPYFHSTTPFTTLNNNLPNLEIPSRIYNLPDDTLPPFQAPASTDIFGLNPSTLEYPDIQVQQHSPPSSVPLEHTPSSSSTASSMIAEGNSSLPAASWDQDISGPFLGSPVRFRGQIVGHFQKPRRIVQGHNRTSSGSSVASAGPASPLDHTTVYPQIADADNSSSNFYLGSDPYTDQPPIHFPKPLPTPTHTPVQSLLAQPFQDYDQQDEHSVLAVKNAMRQAGFVQQHDHMAEQNESPAFTASTAQSVSSRGIDSPATPQTNDGDNTEAYRVQSSHGENNPFDIDAWIDEYLRSDVYIEIRPNVPRFDRTMSDVYQDELFNPATTSAPQQPTKPTVNITHASNMSSRTLLSPYQNVISERLRDARKGHDRSHSPADLQPRERSPFQPSSPFAPASPMRLPSAAQQREQRKTEAANEAFMNSSTVEENAPKTISPKDALLEYQEPEDGSRMPLFPQPTQEANYNMNFHSHNGIVNRAVGVNMRSPHPQGYGAMPGDTRQNSEYQPASLPEHQPFTFVPSTMSHQPSMPQQTQYPFLSQTRQYSQSSDQTQTPDFPTHLTSMETSVSSDSGHHNFDTTSHQAQPPFRRPSDTSADTGTYTCTYQNCTLRFETPAKLQKHKREGHRQSHPPGSSSNPNVLARNSQAGPHKCERINPTTGKPCNTQFSRPYDLTRHEDTIHNAKKQKVRCHLCTEEKTFSRNDALTRHMRVVHPDVDWPGKSRRGRREE